MQLRRQPGEPGEMIGYTVHTMYTQQYGQPVGKLASDVRLHASCNIRLIPNKISLSCDRSCSSVRSSVSTLSFEPTDLRVFDLGVYGSLIIITCRGLKVKVIGQWKLCVSIVASYQYRFMVVVEGFHRDVIICELARRSVRRGAAKASDSGGVPIGLTSIHPPSSIEASLSTSKRQRLLLTV